MILLIRTDMSGFLLEKPWRIKRENIPSTGSTFYATDQQRIYQHVVNHSYSADDNSPLFKGIVHAIYTIRED